MASKALLQKDGIEIDGSIISIALSNPPKKNQIKVNSLNKT